MTNERYQGGLETLLGIYGPAGENVIINMREVAPDFADYLVESFGVVYSRPNLDLRTREFSVVAILAALGNATPQLKVHLHGALNVGCAEQEILEVLMQVAFYAGMPAAINGFLAAKEVFRERKMYSLAMESEQQETAGRLANR